MPTYEVIVIGVGAMGSATLLELARRGVRVLGLEQYQPGHANGSSHGQTRIIRQAYFEHPVYVPLVRRAQELWLDLEQCSGQSLFTSCPCLHLGSPDQALIAGVKLSAATHQLPVQELTAEQVQQRFPVFANFPAEWVGLLEESSGFLRVEECVKTLAEQAVQHGAELRITEQVQSWTALPDGVEVRTRHGVYTAERLVITAGGWAGELLRDLGLPLKIMRQVQHWFPAKRPELVRRDRFPIFIADTDQGQFYGLPMIDPRGVKVAQHFGAPELDSPAEVDWTVNPFDARLSQYFLQKHLPSLCAPPTSSKVCFYTLTPDKHFLIDQHPHHAQVWFAAGFSGHGFKFSTVVGEALAEWVIHNRARPDLDFFRLKRLAE